MRAPLGSEAASSIRGTSRRATEGATRHPVARSVQGSLTTGLEPVFTSSNRNVGCHFTPQPGCRRVLRLSLLAGGGVLARSRRAGCPCMRRGISMITVVGLAQGLQLYPLLRSYGARSATSIAGVRSRSTATRAQVADEHAGEAGADAASPIAWKDATLPTNEDNAGNLLRIRHSTAHVMAMAVQKLFKGTKVRRRPRPSRADHTTPVARIQQEAPCIGR